jgi:hypothetical protein
MEHAEVTPRSFRLALAWLWLGAGFAHVLLAALCVLAINLAGLAVDWLGLVVVTLAPSVYWVVYGLSFRLKVSACGLGWVNLSGVKCFLPWADIEQAERRRQLGLPTLAIWSATQGGPFHVPLFVSDPGELRDAVLEAAAEAHPVTVAIFE